MRVIAGALGGRRLVAPRGAATRPTSDRVREALFSALGGVNDARVLDLFAGTGALGIEALSRGASHATFVESAKPALAALRANLKDLGLEARARIVASTVERASASLGGPFDLVLADPPYASVGALPQLFARFGDAIALDGRLVVEHASRDAAPEIDGFARASPRVYGDTALTFYERPS